MEETRIINQSSLEMTKNSKGYTWSIKAYGDDTWTIEQKAKELIEKAKTMATNLELQEIGTR